MKRKRRRECQEDQEREERQQKVIAMMEKMTKSMDEANKLDDDDVMHYFMSIAPLMRSIPLVKRHQLQQQITSMILQIKANEEAVTSPTFHQNTSDDSPHLPLLVEQLCSIPHNIDTFASFFIYLIETLK